MIALDVALALEILDDFTGRPLKPAALRFSLDGQEARPIQKDGGWFVFLSPGPGMHELSVRAPGYQGERLTFPGVGEGEEPRLETLRLLPAPDYRFGRRVTTLTLRFLDKSGRPPRDLEVYRLGSDRQSLRLAQDDAAAGARALRLFAPEKPARLPLPGLFYLEDGEAGELLCLSLPEGAIYALETPLRLAHKRGRLLRPCRALRPDAEGRAFLALGEETEARLLIKYARGFAVKTAEAAPYADARADIVLD